MKLSGKPSRSIDKICLIGKMETLPEARREWKLSAGYQECPDSDTSLTWRKCLTKRENVVRVFKLDPNSSHGFERLTLSNCRLIFEKSGESLKIPLRLIARVRTISKQSSDG